MESQHSKNIQKWLRYIETNKLRKQSHWAPLDNLLKFLGVQKPPVIFWSFRAIWLTYGTYFAVIMSVIAFLRHWDSERVLVTLLLTIIGVSASIGTLSAWYIGRLKRKVGLTTWQAFLSEADEENSKSSSMYL